MLSAIKRHFKSDEQESQQQPQSNQQQKIPAALQAKFQRGIDVNMKIVICGKKKSGKSALLNRLKGRPHDENYYASTEIVQAVTVNWNYKSTSDVVKVDAWEIQEDRERDYVSTASGVIHMLNCRDSLELERLLDESVPLVPPDTPLLIVANFSDQDELNQDANPDHLAKVKVAQTKRTAPLYYCKASMATGRGLSMIYKFFNVPYLRLKRKQLQESLAQTEDELDRAEGEMETAEKTQNGKTSGSADRVDKEKAIKAEKEKNALVMASDDDISISSLNDQCLFSSQTPRTVIGGGASENAPQSKPDSPIAAAHDDDSFDVDNRATPLGGSGDKVPTPDLRAPLAIPDSPFSSTIGDSSMYSSVYTNQSSPGSTPDYYNASGLNYTSSSINNFLALHESPSF